MKDNKIDSFPAYEALLKKEKKRSKKRFIFFSIINSFVFLILGAFLSIQFLGSFTGLTSRDQAYRKFMQVYEIIRKDWYFGEGDATNEAFIERALLAMINEQNDDAYLTYYPVSSLQSDFGLGITVRLFDGYLLIQDVYTFSPAQGELLPGDIIYQVNGTDLRGLSLSAIIPLIRGEEGTSVTLDIMRGEALLQKQIIRGTARNATTLGYTTPDYGVLQIKGFENDTVQGARAILDGFVEDHISNLVIDLRDNGGGYIMAFQALADLFTPKGVTYGIYHHRNPQDNYAAKSQSNPRYQFEEIVILINHNTASAAESFTAALVDHVDNVTVVGTLSYGKGIAQKTITFLDGSQLRYTYAEYYRVNQVKLHEVGILPDVILDVTGFHLVFQRAFDELETWSDRLLEYLIVQDYGAPATDPATVISAYQQAKSLVTSGEFDRPTLLAIIQDFYLQKQQADVLQLQQAATMGG